MDEAEELSELIGVVYDAALDPTRWREALARCAKFVDGSAATLLSKDQTTRGGGLLYEFNASPYYGNLYFEKYFRLDPYTTIQFFAEIDVPISRADIIDEEEFLESRFYREWVQPQGIADCVSTVLHKSDTGAAVLAISRDERRGLVDDKARRRMRLISPHVRRAIMVGRAVDLGRSQTETFAEVLDNLAAAVFFVMPNGRITHANKSARDLIASSDVLYVARDRLVSVDPVCNKALIDVIGAASNGDISLSANGISMPLNGREGIDYVAHVLPLTSGLRRETSIDYSATAAIFVHKSNRNTVSAPEAIAKAFSLTPTELRIFLGVAEIGGAPDVAEAFGVSVNTVKSHLQRIFSKTGASRQAELVKLLSDYASPFSN